MAEDPLKDPLNGVALAPVEPTRITIEVRPNGQLVVAWTESIDPELFVAGALALLKTRHQITTQPTQPRLVLPAGLLRG